MKDHVLAARLKEVRTKLEATDRQMAKHMKMDLEYYQSLESGARILPLVNRQRLDKRMKGLLERCGLK